jgi:hypothetical protein
MERQGIQALVEFGWSHKEHLLTNNHQKPYQIGNHKVINDKLSDSLPFMVVYNDSLPYRIMSTIVINDKKADSMPF